MLLGKVLAADSDVLRQLRGRTQDVGSALQGRVAPLHGVLGPVAPTALGDFLRALTLAREAHERLLGDADGYFSDATSALTSIDRGLDGHEGEYSRVFGGLMEV